MIRARYRAKSGRLIYKKYKSYKSFTRARIALRKRGIKLWINTGRRGYIPF